jgi:hypothetical protein
MRLPGFNADATLYKADRLYLERKFTEVGRSSGQLVTQRSIVCDIGFDHCLDRCDDRICRFDDIGDLCGECGSNCVEENQSCEAIFSSGPSTA